MKANEIRLGIHIIDVFNPKNPTERQIDLDDLAMLGNYKNHHLPFKPIPLTEELLLKFGFEFRNNDNHYGWYLVVSKNRVLTWCHSKEISLEFDYEDYNYNNTLFDFNCEYVHQLQNLYFALSNEELTLKQN